MSGSIGKLALQLSAEPSQFLSDLGRAAWKAGQNFLAQAGMTAGLPSFLQAGSAEAVSAVNRDAQRSQIAEQNPLKIVPDILKQMQEIDKQQLEQLKVMAADAGRVILPGR